MNVIFLPPKKRPEPPVETPKPATRWLVAIELVWAMAMTWAFMDLVFYFSIPDSGPTIYTQIVVVLVLASVLTWFSALWPEDDS